MKYTIETMGNGYVETLEICGKSYVKTWESTERGTYRCKEGDFTDRIVADGVVPEAYDVVDDYVCGLDMHCFERDYMGD